MFYLPGKIELLGRPSWQSDTYQDAVSDLAIDGNLDPSYNHMHCSHPAYGINPWWGVDMGTVRQVASLQIVNRDTLGE